MAEATSTSPFTTNSTLSVTSTPPLPPWLERLKEFRTWAAEQDLDTLLNIIENESIINGQLRCGVSWHDVADHVHEGMTAIMCSRNRRISSSSVDYSMKDASSTPAFVAEDVEFLRRIKRQTDKRMLCGYTFKHGDIAFNCRTCQTDDTCVLCLSCYQNSDHEGHEVYFHRTTPGGMCDCGDAEAWKPTGFCKNHGQVNVMSEDIHENIPESIDRIGYALIKQAIDFIVGTIQLSYESFSKEHVAQLYALCDKDAKDFYVRIFNDDIHSDEDLISSLNMKKIPNAAILTRNIDSSGYGYALEKCSFRDALLLMTQLKKEDWFVGVIHSDYLVREKIAMALIQWIRDLCTYSQKLEHHVETILLMVNPSIGRSNLSTLFIHDAYIMKGMVLELHNFYMCLIGNKNFKIQFSKLFIQHYPALMSDFIRGIGTQNEMLFHFGVQIFTTPSIVTLLVKPPHNFLRALMNSYFECILASKQIVMPNPSSRQVSLLNASSDMTLSMVAAPVANTNNTEAVNIPDILQDEIVMAGVLDPIHTVIKFKRYSFLNRDLEYILNIKDVAGIFCSDRQLVDKCFRLLQLIQNMQLQTRRKEGQPHVEMEDFAWVYAFNLHLNFNSLYSLILRGIQQPLEDGKDGDEVVLTPTPLNRVAIGNLQDCILSRMGHFLRSEGIVLCKKDLKYPLISCDTVAFDVSSQPVSFHHPLHHFCAKFILERLSLPCEWMADAIVPQDDGLLHLFEKIPLSTDEGKMCLFGLLEYPMRVMVLCSQVQAGLWKRNGTNTMMGQTINYINAPLCRDMRDLDLVLMQFGALHVGLDAFLAMLFDKYQLVHWFFCPASFQEQQLHSDLVEKYLDLAEEFLLNFIWLITELPYPPDDEGSLAGSSSSDYSALAVRREIIHHLAEKPATHSELLDRLTFIKKLLSTKPPKEDRISLDGILKDVACLVEQTDRTYDGQHALGPSKYELKFECYLEYDPCFYHLTRSQHEKAQSKRLDEYERRRRQALNGKVDASTPVVGAPPPAHPLFQSFREIILKKPVFMMINQILVDHFEQHIHRSSEMLFARALHLCTLQMHVFNALSNERRMEVKDDFFVSVRGATEGEDVFVTILPEKPPILALLVEVLQTDPKPPVTTSLAITWLLQQYNEADTRSQSYIQKKKVFAVELDESKENVMARRKKRQQEAMEAMMRRQAAFASTLALEGEELQDKADFDKVDEKGGGIDDEDFVPDCIICSEEKKEKPIMYVGLVQKSGVLKHTYVDEWREPFHVGSRVGASMFVQICGHAVHHDCWDGYFASVVERSERSLTLERNVAINVSTGEFLCPLCQTYSNCLIPHVSWTQPKSRQTRPVVVATALPATIPASFHTTTMEEVFRTGDDPTFIYHWLTKTLPSQLQQLPGLLSTREKKSEMMLRRLADRVIEVGAFNPVEDRALNGLSTKSSAWERIHTLWAMITYTFRCHELLGVSKVVASRADVNEAMESLDGRLLLNTSSIEEEMLDSIMSATDETRFNHILAMLKNIFLLYDSTEDYREGITRPLERLFNCEACPPSWQSAVHTSTPFALCRPILLNDMLYLFIVILSNVKDRADVLMSMRMLGIAHSCQVLLRTLDWGLDQDKEEKRMNAKVLDGIPTDDKADYISKLESLRSQLAESVGIEVLDEAPTGFELLCIYEAGCLSFLRQMTLVCRVLFRGSDAEATEHTVFVNSLRLRTNLAAMQNQLGIPTLTQVMASTEWMDQLLKWGRQLASWEQGAIPYVIYDAACKGEDASLKVKAEASMNATRSSLTALPMETSLEEQIVRSSPRWNTHHQRMKLSASSLQNGFKPWSFLDEECVYTLPIAFRSSNNSHGSDLVARYATTRLIPLPYSYTDLHVLLSQQKCPQTKEVRSNPAICLLCGTVVCAGVDCCREVDSKDSSFQRGACTAHAQTCQNGLGLFFLLHKCTTLFILGPRSCYFASPYVDAFGEEDRNLRRGRPLFLNSQNLNVILTLYIHHRIAHEVVRSRRTSDHYIRSNFY